MHTKFLEWKSLDFWLTFQFPSLHQLTSLHLAAESGRIKILKYLVDKRADINHQDDNGVITTTCANNRLILQGANFRISCESGPIRENFVFVASNKWKRPNVIYNIAPVQYCHCERSFAFLACYVLVRTVIALQNLLPKQR